MLPPEGIRVDMRGQVVAVLGASGALGRESAARLAGRGATLVLQARRRAPLEATARTLGGVTAVAGDLKRPSTLRSLAAAVEEKGRLDGVLVAVGRADHTALGGLETAELRRILEVNLELPILAVRSLLPFLLRRKSGSIVLVSSVWGLEPASGEVVYAAAKTGLIGFGRSLAEELRPSGVRVNVLAPAAFESPMLDWLDKKARRDLAERQGGSILSAGAVADRAIALLHPDCTATGHVVEVGTISPPGSGLPTSPDGTR